MSNLQVKDKEEEFHIDKASKWTVYFLIDLRIVFIITYVYISVVYLISTTANSEANADVNSLKLFNVTSQPNHSDVMVSYIDDAVLWGCRKLSMTKTYYKGLYAMLFGAFALTLMILTITKLTIVIGNSTGISHLWKIAVVQYLQAWQATEDTDARLTDDELAKVYLNLLKTYESKSFLSNNLLQKAVSIVNGFFKTLKLINLGISVFILHITVGLALISYDLHASSCLWEPSEEFINYDLSTQTVELRHSENILLSQNIIFGFILFFGLVLLLNAGCFYLCNSIIINNLKPCVNFYLNEKKKQSPQQLPYDETAV